MDEEQVEQWVKELIRTNKIHAFYISAQWKKVCKLIRREQNNECQRCKKNKTYQYASTVHHKKHLRQFPKLALTKSNLELICDSCHWDEHHKEMKQKGFTNQEKW